MTGSMVRNTEIMEEGEISGELENRDMELDKDKEDNEKRKSA